MTICQQREWSCEDLVDVVVVVQCGKYSVGSTEFNRGRGGSSSSGSSSGSGSHNDEVEYYPCPLRSPPLPQQQFKRWDVNNSGDINVAEFRLVAVVLVVLLLLVVLVVQLN